jgi:hypothetical protein
LSRFVITSAARDLFSLTTGNRQLFSGVILSAGGASPPESKDPYVAQHIFQSAITTQSDPASGVILSERSESKDLLLPHLACNSRAPFPFSNQS